MFWLGILLGVFVGFVAAAFCHKIHDDDLQEWVELHKKYEDYCKSQAPRVIR